MLDYMVRLLTIVQFFIAILLIIVSKVNLLCNMAFLDTNR